VAVITLNYVAAVLALISSIFWFCVVSLKVTKQNNATDGWHDAVITDDGINVLETIKLQQKWGRRAALLAAFAALFQAISLVAI